MKTKQIPKRVELFEPMIQALKNLNGSGSISEINEEVFRLLNISDEIIATKRKANEKRAYNESAIEYELAWVRTILKQKGILEKSSRGIWALKDFSDQEPQPLVDSIQEQGTEVVGGRNT